MADDGWEWSGGSSNSSSNNPAIAPIVTELAGKNCNFYKLPDEKMVVCPYNDSHEVLENRFARHLLKCRAAYEKDCEMQNKPKKMQICLYNRSHHVHKDKMEEHIKNCPDKIKMDKDTQKWKMDNDFVKPKEDMDKKNIVKFENMDKKAIGKFDHLDKKSPVKPGGSWKIPDPTGAHVFKDDDEDWGAKGSNVLPYDPTERIQGLPIMVVPPGMNRSERRSYRESERARLNEMDFLKDYEKNKETFAERTDAELDKILRRPGQSDDEARQ